MAIALSNTMVGVRGNKRYYTGDFQLSGGSGQENIVTGLSSIEGGNVSYVGGVGGVLSPAYQNVVSLNPGEVQITLDVNAAGSFEFWGL